MSIILTLKIKGTDYSAYIIEEPSTSIAFEDYRIIGNAPSMSLSLALNNLNGTFTDLINEDFVLFDYSSGEQIGIFNVIEKPERMTGNLSLTLYDKMVLTNVPYATDTSKYPQTIKSQLDEMVVLTSLLIDYSALPQDILNQNVSWYDNTIGIRDYLCWIAEISACNVFCDTLGNLKFVQVLKDVKHHISQNDVEEFDKIDDYVCSKIVFDDGINTDSIGSDTNNTLYLSTDNSYLTDNSTGNKSLHERLEYIYTKIGNISFSTVDGFKTIEKKEIRIGDIIDFGGLFNFIALNIEHRHLSGKYGIQIISGNLKIKNAEIVTSHFNDTVRIKRLTTKVDQEEVKLNVLANVQDEDGKRIGSLEVSSEKIGLEVDKIDTKVDNIPIPQASPLPPEVPKEGQVWVDITMNPPTEKIYSNGEWVVVGDYKGDLAGLSGQISSLNTSLSVEQGKIETLIQDNKTIINGNEVTLKEAYSYIHQEVNSIQVAIGESGGNNKLLNSCGWNGIEYWQTSGTVTSFSDVGIRNSTISGYAFTLDINSIMTQSFKTIIGHKYSVSCKVNKGFCPCTLVIKNGTTQNVLFNLDGEYMEGWLPFSMPFEALDTICTVQVETGSGRYPMTISDIMVNDGEIAQQWSSSNDEIYTLNVKIDQRGIEVSQDGTNNRTVINTKEFAGYDGSQKVFSVNGDITTVNRLKATGDVQIGVVRAYAKTAGTITGLGFAYIKGGSL